MCLPGQLPGVVDGETTSGDCNSHGTLATLKREAAHRHFDRGRARLVPDGEVGSGMREAVHRAGIGHPEAEATEPTGVLE